MIVNPVIEVAPLGYALAFFAILKCIVGNDAICCSDMATGVLLFLLAVVALLLCLRGYSSGNAHEKQHHVYI